ncbi:hypothetical protein QAD02_013660 [Eretmocerus hayati]|uniref:Uncharacterized protein n=1 Tax=Eretmocerus hayati TaxID=131215 RepID=A0ACC2P329_9HYME|nr:hypothetical protein QAD02_013660 [Eretmocerus hayati]
MPRLIEKLTSELRDKTHLAVSVGKREREHKQRKADRLLAKQYGVEFPDRLLREPSSWRKNTRKGKAQRIREKLIKLEKEEKLIDIGIRTSTGITQPLRDESPDRECCVKCKSNEKCRDCVTRAVLSMKIPRKEEKEAVNELMNGKLFKCDSDIFRKFILESWKN